jgi:uncharacterized protein
LTYDYVFVGAGPANLAAANVLLNRGITNILVLEEGSGLNKRACPGLSKSLCTHCNGMLCHVTGGEGGSSARLGNKLCYFPASKRILRYFDRHILSLANNYLDELLSPHFDSRLSDDDPHECEINTFGPIQKHYIADVLLRREFGQLIETLLSEPRRAGVIRLNAPVTEIRKRDSSDFGLMTATDLRVQAKRIVFGSGRTSYRFLTRMFQALGIEYEDNQPDVGIRVEAAREFVTSGCTYQADPKYKFIHPPYGSSRTFCGCDGGIIVPVKFGRSYYADGAFGDELTGVANVAFMVRSLERISIDDLESWCARVNLSSKGSLLLGEVPLDAATTNQAVGKIMALVPDWLTEHHEKLMTKLLTWAFGSGTPLLRPSDQSESKVRIYGPAVDLYWPRPRLRKGLATNVRGVFVLGDVTGVSRGFVQAMVCGAAWAINLLSDGSRTHVTQGVEEWSVLE